MTSSWLTTIVLLFYLGVQSQFEMLQKYLQYYQQARHALYRNPQKTVNKFCRVPKGVCALEIYWKQAGVFVDICADPIPVFDPRFRPIRWYKLQLVCSLNLSIEVDETQDAYPLKIFDVQTIIKS